MPDSGACARHRRAKRLIPEIRLFSCLNAG
nr:MAG TPA_asm: hypothetical protein [Caudoviricetes sp.]